MSLLAGDACTDPGSYMVDKRCYVTVSQSKSKPYNSVMRVLRPGAVQGGDCSGIIVKSDDKFYLYTAKHCTDLNDDKVPDATLKIKLQNEREITVYKNNTGDLDLRNNANLSGDWAVYAISEDDIAAVTVSGVAGVTRAKAKSGSSINVVGYGRLKIMSDQEIKDFKQQYVTWLKNHNITKHLGDYGVEGNSVNTNNRSVTTFIKQMDSVSYNKMFNDKRLKVSSCKYVGGGQTRYCQIWHGNSGGGIFDTNGNLIGLVSYGENYIGGVNNHAKLTGAVFW